ncbi:PREDICTED: uncharacterized protein LOC104732928 [Camelina sativa]|uniref:Uncharacterized protein LOC104732928 n=1 Tax=Camelina sativa TaxID=90675 RepID=A0ABM1QRB8_CAMSA|nr:PREDICTED: uncharacterized protein LOC104732928 [Camelina sativa]
MDASRTHRKMDAGAEIDVVNPVEDDSAAETGPDQDQGGGSESSSLKQGEILRTLATVEKDSQAIAESFAFINRLKTQFQSLCFELLKATGYKFQTSTVSLIRDTTSEGRTSNRKDRYEFRGTKDLGLLM